MLTFSRDFVRNHCWLINREGKRDTHLPIDQGQEQNIGDIKVNGHIRRSIVSGPLNRLYVQVTYRSCGPSADIEQIGNLSPAIPVFRAIRDHMKWQHKLILSRGTKHTDPNKDGDVAEFRDAAVEGEWLKYTPGRTISRTKDKAPDVMTAGITNLTIGGQFERWFDNRSFVRETGQVFSSDSEREATEDESSDSSSSSSKEVESDSESDAAAAAPRTRQRRRRKAT